ncbi:MAG: class I SAM-dependent methyltransferase [Burkholderiales bacterium]|nr:class I SAM-dependent methyltransferase [Burkholderiales bacterium]
MGIIGGTLGYQLLRRIAPRSASDAHAPDPSEADTKLSLYFGPDFFSTIAGQTVLDFGCGRGGPAVEMAQRGAGKVIGLDIQERLLEICRVKAQRAGVSDRCVFTTQATELADIVISKDAFEHFDDPAAILRIMATLLKPDGYVLAAFGPTWLHPHGGHIVSVFPWSHLVFSEQALIRWRADFKTDGATRFREVAGGLNQLTIAQFERIVADSPFQIEWLDTLPIRGIPLLKTRLLRELGSSIVRCKLTLKPH